MFIPGDRIKTFKSASGKDIVLCYPKWEDLTALTSYINALAQEDTYILIGKGMDVTKKVEMEYLSDALKYMESNDRTYLFATHKNKLIGNCAIRRIIRGNREKHVGTVGISVAKEYRGDGIGREMLSTLIAEGREKMKLKLLILTAYEPNTRAMRLYESLGFTRVGVIPEAIYFKNQYVGKIPMYLRLS